MKNLTWLLNFIKQDRWNILYLFWVTFFVPLFFFQSANLDNYKIINQVFYSFVFSIQLYCFSLLTNGVFKRIYFILIFIVFFLPSMVVLSAIYINKSFLKDADFWFVFQTNTDESIAFLGNYLSWGIGLLVLIYTVVSFYLLSIKTSMGSVSIRRKSIILLPVVAFMLLSGFSYSMNASNYVVDFYKSLYKYNIGLKLYDNHIEERLSNIYNVSSNLPDTLPKTFVIIIGESLDRGHMSIYGYNRHTNPFLEKIENKFFVFNNVISSDTQTSGSLKKALTFANHEFPDYYYKKPSIIELFNALNFRTYWIDNQFNKVNDVAPDIYVKIARLSKVYVNLNFSKQDESVLPVLKNILNRKDEINKFIVIHLMGCHLPYKTRYPRSFTKFTGFNDINSRENKLLTLDQKKTINEYDNSVLYNDFVVSSIINLVEAKKELAYILYFSDHGEEVYDKEVFSGRSYDNLTVNMCEIPFMIWLSDDYKNKKTLHVDANRPYSVENLIHTVIDLSFIKHPDYDSTRSLISKDFKERIRYVNGKNYSTLPQ